MDQSTKQRVVGITVIVIAAVVLLPVLFDGQGSYELPIESRIPEPSPFPIPPRITPERPVIVADGVVPDVVTVVTDAPVEPLLQDQVVTNAVEEPLVQDQVETSTVLSTQTPVNSSDNSADNAPVSIDDIIASLNLDAAQREAETDNAAPGLDAAGLPEGWSVRLASFSSDTNAQKLVERLQSAGHRAYTRQIASSQGPLIAVFVGPGADQAAVQQLRAQLQEQFELSGIVVRYEIEEL